MVHLESSPEPGPRGYPSRVLSRPAAIRFVALLVPFLLVTTLVGPTGRTPAAGAVVSTDSHLLAADGVSNRATVTSTNIDSEVWAMESVGATLLVGGKFRNVKDRSTNSAVNQGYLAAFDANTGEFIPWFRPQVDGPIYDIKSVGNGQIVIAGEFTSVNGQPHTAGMARINLADGSVDTGFVSSIDGAGISVIRSIAVTDSHIYAAGAFATHVGPDGTERSVAGVFKVARSNGALDSSFSPTITGGGVWGVAYNSDHDRVFAVGFFSGVNGSDAHGLAVLEPATGDSVGSFEAELSSSYLSQAASAGNALHDVETVGDRVIITTKHHLYMVLDADAGDLIGTSASNGTQRVELSQDGQYAYFGCHCDGTGYLRTVNLATGKLTGKFLDDVKGTAGVWAVTELSNGCVWTGGSLSYDSAGSQAVHNMVRLCNSAEPAAIGGGSSAPQREAAPSRPSAPQLSQSGATVTLAWSPSTDGGDQVSYIVYRNGVEVGRTGSNSYRDLLVPTGVHQWSVAGVGLSGTTSAPSELSAPLEIGSPRNIAPSYGFAASPGRNGTSPAAMTDRNLGTYWYPENKDGSSHFYFQFDFGSHIPIDYVLIHESDVQLATLGLAAATLKLSDTAFPNVRSEDQAKPFAFASIQVDRYYMPVVRLDVADEVRGLRLDSYNNFGQAIDELEVYTTDPLPTPAAPDDDTERPMAPAWSRVRTLGSQPILEWGGASDNRGVVSYEIWSNNTKLGTTSETMYPIASADDRASSYEIVAVDLAGNRSHQVTDIISTDKPAEQSSTGYSATADRAVDGNTNGAWAAASLSHTTQETGPWWQVDLGSSEAIGSVRLWNRTGCCQHRLNHVVVFVSQQPFAADATIASLSATDGVHRFDLGDDALGTTTTVDINQMGRYVRVALDTTGYLALAEVEVMRGDEVAVNDTERPTRPVGLEVTSGEGIASLQWNAATDNVGVVAYDIYRLNPDGSQTHVAQVEGLDHVDSTVTPGETYQYFLKAVDAAGNTSWRNGYVGVTIGGEADSERPSRPVQLKVTSDNGAASLQWHAATDNVGVVAYDVYRVDPDGSQALIHQVAELAYVDTTVTAGQSYQYFLKAVDAAGNTSWRNGYVPVDIVGGAPSDSCQFSRANGSVRVTWSLAADADEVVIERSANGGQFWWRGRVDADAGSWTDTDRNGALVYQIKPKVGANKGDPIRCTAG